MTVYATIGCKLNQNANEGCNSCASLAGLVFMFYCMFYFTCDHSFKETNTTMPVSGCVLLDAADQVMLCCCNQASAKGRVCQ